MSLNAAINLTASISTTLFNKGALKWGEVQSHFLSEHLRVVPLQTSEKAKGDRQGQKKQQGEGERGRSDKKRAEGGVQSTREERRGGDRGQTDIVPGSVLVSAET